MSLLFHKSFYKQSNFFCIMLLRLSNFSLLIFLFSLSFASASFFSYKTPTSTPDWGSAVHEDASKVRDISSLIPLQQCLSKFSVPLAIKW